MKYQFNILALLALVSCGKAGKILQQPQDVDTLLQPQVRPYQGDTLTIKDQKNAYISITGKDAEVLYETLQLKEIAFDGGETLSKTGTYIWCAKQLAKSETEKPFVSCGLNVNPVTGVFSANTVTSKEDKGINNREEDYIGNLLALFPHSQQFNIAFNGEDARKLYESLNFLAVEHEDGAMKVKTKGKNPLLSCKEVFNKSSLLFSYSCSFDLRINNGTFADAPSWELHYKKKEKEAQEREIAPEVEAEVVPEVNLEVEEV